VQGFSDVFLLDLSLLEDEVCNDHPNDRRDVLQLLSILLELEGDLLDGCLQVPLLLLNDFKLLSDDGFGLSYVLRVF
jgi:hypothetical protein